MAQQDAPPQPGAISALPLEPLARVLSWLPTGERLACARVCRVWREAAAAATTSLSVEGISHGKADQVSAWIAQYGEQLQELSATGAWPDRDRPTLALATSRLPGLRSLDLAEIWLEELPSPGQQLQAPSSLGGLPQLERLRLDTCQLAWPGALAGLSALSRLQSLELADLGGEGCSGAELAAALASAWRQLRALTSLYLGSDGVTAAALAGLGSCTSLEELGLRGCSLGRISLSPSKQPGVFSDIAQLRRLTSLRLWGDGISIAPAPASGGAAVGATPALSSLQRLMLRSLNLEPAALAELPQLQAIDLHRVALIGGSEEQATRQLLAQLGRQTQLAELHLSTMTWLDVHPAAAYAGLTASSQLTALLLYEPALPGGVAVHLFGAGRSLPQLHVLHITGCGEHLFGPGDLQHLVAAAPGLRSLTLVSSLPAGQSLQPLTGLAALTELTLGGEVHGVVPRGRGFTQSCDCRWGWLDPAAPPAAAQVLDDESAASLAQLSQLQRLQLHYPSEQMSWRGLLQLTQLARLTSFCLVGCALLVGADDGDELEPETYCPEMLMLSSTAPAGQPPDVATQLLTECCRRDPGVLADVLEQAAGERAALRAQLAERDAQLAEAQAKQARAQAALAQAQAALAAAGIAL